MQQITISQSLLQAATPRNLLRCLLAVVLCTLLFWPLILGFQTASNGLRPLDTQTVLSVELIQSQLAQYGPDSLRSYAAFSALDFLFPPLLSLEFALLWGWLLQHSRWQSGLKMAANGLILLPFVSTLADWLENICTLLTLWLYPGYTGITSWLLNFKYLKLTSLGINACLAFCLALLAGTQHRRSDNKQP